MAKEERYNWPPLKLQFEQGQKAFRSRRQWSKDIETTRVTAKGDVVPLTQTVITTANPYDPHTMKHREWQRGYDTAYFERLKK